MRAASLIGPALFIAGLALLAFAVGRGEASLSLVLVFPVIVATGILGGAGIFLMILAFLVSFFLWPFRAEPMPADVTPSATAPRTAMEVPPPAKRWGGVMFLGPVPVVFGSDPGITRTMLLVAVILFLALLALIVFSILAI